MAAPKIRADHDGLQSVSQKFAQQAEATRRILGQTKADKSTLESGDWQGKGAAAFYREMNDMVLPTLERLARALESASQVTKQISGVMKQVEEEASGLLDGEQTWDEAAQFVADAHTGVLTIHAGGETHVVSVYAPGMLDIADMVSEEEMDALFRENKAEETRHLSSEKYAGKVGAFEGANYEAKGYYRPQVDCIMFTRNDVPFCAVCRRAIERVIDLYSR